MTLLSLNGEYYCQKQGSLHPELLKAEINKCMEINNPKPFEFSKYNVARNMIDEIDLDRVKCLLILDEIEEAISIFELIPEPTEFNFEYKLIKTRISLESAENDDMIDFDEISSLIYPENQVGLLETLCGTVRNRQWETLKEYLDLIFPMVICLGPFVIGVCFICTMILDTHNDDQRGLNAIVQSFDILNFRDYDDYMEFIEHARLLADDYGDDELKNTIAFCIAQTQFTKE